MSDAETLRLIAGLVTFCAIQLSFIQWHTARIAKALTAQQGQSHD